METVEDLIKALERMPDKQAPVYVMDHYWQVLRPINSIWGDFNLPGSGNKVVINPNSDGRVSQPLES